MLVPPENIVEFSNDGITDSLTGAPAPKIFLDNLEREIAKSKRKYQAISIITVKLNLETNRNQKLKKKSVNRSSISQKQKMDLLVNDWKFEKELAEVGRHLKSKMRSGDFYSRFAENGFWICIQGDINDAKKASERFSLDISRINRVQGEIPQVLYIENQWDTKMNQDEWIREIDLVFFGHMATS